MVLWLGFVFNLRGTSHGGLGGGTMKDLGGSMKGEGEDLGFCLGGRAAFRRRE